MVIIAALIAGAILGSVALSARATLTVIVIAGIALELLRFELSWNATERCTAIEAHASCQVPVPYLSAVHLIAGWLVFSALVALAASPGLMLRRRRGRGRPIGRARDR